MTIQQLDFVHQTRPFVPFKLHMADGRSFYVRHPEFLARSPSGKEVTVYSSADAGEVLDVRLMTSIEKGPLPMPKRGRKKS